MDLRFVGILFIFGCGLAAVFLHYLDRFRLRRRNLKRVCKSQELPGPGKCSPHKCDPLLDSYLPHIPPPPPPPPSFENVYGYLPQSSGPSNTRPSFFDWASCRAPLPHSSVHELPQSSGPTNTPANFLDWASGRAPSNEQIARPHRRSCYFSDSPMSSHPMDKGYVKDFPVVDLHRDQLLALQNRMRATALNKLPGNIGATATSVTGCHSAHVIGMDESKDSLLGSQREKQ